MPTKPSDPFDDIIASMDRLEAGARSHEPPVVKLGLGQVATAKQQESQQSQQQQQLQTVVCEPDIYRDTWVRYLGYSNEIGEAFFPIAPKLLAPSYGLVFLYVLADCTSRRRKAADAGCSFWDQVKVAFDAYVFQMAASVAIPGLLIRHITRSTTAYLRSEGAPRQLVRNPMVKRFGGTAAGLLAIPLIVRPIDWSVNKVLDWTLRWVVTVPSDHQIHCRPTLAKAVAAAAKKEQS